MPVVAGEPSRSTRIVGALEGEPEVAAPGDGRVGIGVGARQEEARGEGRDEGVVGGLVDQLAAQRLLVVAEAAQAEQIVELAGPRAAARLEHQRRGGRLARGAAGAGDEVADGLHVEQVAEDDGEVARVLRAERGIGRGERDAQGGAAAPERGVVHDVVVDEHEEVEQLHPGGEALDLGALGGAAPGEAPQQHELRAEEMRGRAAQRQRGGDGLAPERGAAVGAQPLDGVVDAPGDAGDGGFELGPGVPGYHRHLGSMVSRACCFMATGCSGAAGRRRRRAAARPRASGRARARARRRGTG